MALTSHYGSLSTIGQSHALIDNTSHNLQRAIAPSTLTTLYTPNSVSVSNADYTTLVVGRTYCYGVIDNTSLCLGYQLNADYTLTTFIDKLELIPYDSHSGDSYTILKTYTYSSAKFNNTSSYYDKINCFNVSSYSDVPGYNTLRVGSIQMFNSNLPFGQLDNNYNLFYDFSDDYLNAYYDGKADGYSEGYDDGLDDGFIDGVSAGISTAIENADEYGLYNESSYLAYGSSEFERGLQNDLSTHGFRTLMATIFNAPYNILHGFLNFEILGINLWALVSFAFTIALIFFVIKLFRE